MATGTTVMQAEAEVIIVKSGCIPKEELEVLSCLTEPDFLMNGFLTTLTISLLIKINRQLNTVLFIERNFLPAHLSEIV